MDLDKIYYYTNLDARVSCVIFVLLDTNYNIFDDHVNYILKNKSKSIIADYIN